MSIDGNNSLNPVIALKNDALVESAKKGIKEWTQEFQAFTAVKIDEAPNKDLYLQTMRDSLNELKDMKRNILEHTLNELGADSRLTQIADAVENLRLNLERTVFVPTSALKELSEIDKSQLNDNQLGILDRVTKQIKEVDIGSNEATRALYIDLMSLVDNLKHDSVELKRVNLFIEKIEGLNRVEFGGGDQKKLNGLLSSVSMYLPKTEIAMTVSHRGGNLTQDSPKIVQVKIMEIYNDAVTKGSLSFFQVVRLEKLLESLKPPLEDLAKYEKFQEIPIDERKSDKAQELKESVHRDSWAHATHYNATKEFVQQLKGRFSL